MLKKLRLFASIVLVVFSSFVLAQTPPANKDESRCNTDLTHDPFQGFNRKVFAFNDVLDRAILRPVATGYRYITPQPVERGVSNFFGNLGEIRNTFNNILQWKWYQAGNDAGRFIVNSTFGIAGLFDVAKHMDLPKAQREDFDQSLAKWGVCSGPFLVLPFIGPSTLRDAFSLPFDGAANPTFYIDHDLTRIEVNALDIIDTRAGLLGVDELVAGDKYLFFRDAYKQRRVYLENDGEVKFDAEDEFADFQ